MPDKKRKRSIDKADRPHKKIAIATPPAVENVNVTLVPDAEELCPVIASTPGLSIPPKITFKPYQKQKKDKRILPPNVKTSAPYELLLQSSAHAKLDFAAREEHDGSADSLLKHYVGVFDPNTGELKVMGAHKLVLRSTLRSETEELRLEREKAAEANKPTIRSMRTELGMAFGTKKAKRAIADVTENAISSATSGEVSAGSVASTLLKSMAENTADMPDREGLQAAVDEAKPRPKANLSATTPAEVYPLETLLGRETMAQLEVGDWIDAAENKKDIQVPSRYVARRLQSLAARKDIQRVKVLRYMLLCINFNAALKPGKPAKKVPPKDELQKKMGVTSGNLGSVADGIRRKFADGSEMPKWNVDFLSTHIAACALFVDNFEVDVFDLREDLRVDNKTITQYFHELGCKVNPPTEAERTKLKITKAEAVNHRVAKLKIPLDFPKQRVMASKRR